MKIKLNPSKYIRIYSDIHLDFDVPKKGFNFSMLWFPDELETDKETTNSVFYFLREIKKSVFIEPTNDILEKYNLNERETFIIKPIISEAPTQNINGIETVTIEKMLVDIFCDDVIFSAQQGGEMRTIFKNAFEKYTINQSKMLRYADRRRKKEELNQFIKTISNLWQ